MTRTLRLLLLSALTFVCGNVLADGEKTVTWLASSGDPLTTVYPKTEADATDTNIQIVWEEGGGDQAPKYSGGNVLFYNGNRLHVKGASNDVTISKVVVTYSSGSASLVLCDAQGKNESTTGITNNYSGMTTTWTGSANSLIFRASKQTNNRYISSIAVTYTGGSAPAELKPELAITNDNIADTYSIDDNGVFVVYYANNGTAAAENAKLTLYVDDVENASKTIGTLGIGVSDFWNAKYNVTELTAGEHTVKLAFTADNADAVNVQKTVTFTKKAPEATFTVTAANVTVAHDATSYQIIAKVKNTSETVNATGVQVMLQKNVQNMVDPQSVDLNAGEEKNVTFTVNAPEGGFTPGVDDNIYVMVKAYDKTVAQQQVTVTFEAAPVVETKDLAITEVLGTIKLAEDNNTIRVTVSNNGNVDITNAPVVVMAGEKKLGESTVSAVVGQSGFCQVAVDKTGLEAGELDVTATVTVEGDATPADNTLTAKVTVEAVPAATATFAITAADVNALTTDENITAVVNVKNTSEVDATNVEVKLIYNNGALCENQTIAALAAGKDQNLTFVFANPFKNAGVYELQAMTTDNKFGGYVKLTLSEPVDETIDMALTALQGISEINLKETNTLQVWYKNNGAAVESAAVALSVKGTVVDTKNLTNVAANASGHIDFVVPTTGLVADEQVEVEVNLSVANDVNVSDNTLQRTYTVVSGEAAPAPKLELNPISDQEVEAAGEQEITVRATIFNTGNADAEGVKIAVYKDFGTNLAEETVNVKAGEENNYAIVTLKFNYDIQKATEFHVSATYNGTVADFKDFTISLKEELPELSIAKIADIEATTADDVKVTATVKNNSTVKAQDVLVAMYNGMEQVGTTQKIEEIAANGTADVEFNLGKLAKGNYDFTVQITSKDANAENNTQSVTVKVAEAVAEKVEVGLTAIQGISNIDLAAEAVNTISVWAENKGTVDADAAISITLNGTAVGEAQTVSMKAGKNGYATFTLPTEGLTVGTKATVVATLAVADNTAAEEALTLTREYDVVNSDVATEPLFTITAQPVEVEFGAEKFDVTAMVKNTTTIDATNVEVQLFYNQVLATQTIETLAGGAEAPVAFTDVQNPFTKAGEYTMYIIANKAQAEVKITVKPQAVEEKMAVELTQVNLSNGHIDLAADSNPVTVWVENKGTMDADAKIAVTLNGAAAGEAQTVNVKAGKNGYATFFLNTEGLVAGEKATIVATVAVEGNTSEKVSETKEYDIVNSAVATEPVFTITAQPVEVEFGAEKFNVVATVKNITEIAAENVEVQLFHNAVIATQTITTLAGNAETQVTFENVANPFTTAGEYTMYVLAPKAQGEVKITVKPEPVAEKVDLAVSAIQGTLSLEQETNYLTVFVDNLGTVDATAAVVTLKHGEKVLGTGTVSPRAGKSAFCTINVAAADLAAGEFEVTATVEAEGDADLTNNTLSKTYTIAGKQAQLSLGAKVERTETGFNVTVKVANSSADVDAEDVLVVLYSEEGAEIDKQTIAKVAAGTAENAVFTLDPAYAGKNIQIFTKGVEVLWLKIEDGNEIDNTNGIKAVKAQFGENTSIYTINGAKINSINKAGIYIVNGKKVVIK